MPSPFRTWPPGTPIGNFTVTGEIARGGQGVVLAATHTTLGTRAAIKLLLEATPETARRFRQEAMVLARLRHPNLLEVPDYGDLPDGSTYMVMEFVDGEDLAARVERAGLPSESWIVRVLRTVAETLAFCHAKGVVHRDIKPQNLMIERETGRPLVVDFGLVRRDRLRLAWQSQDPSSISSEGELMGTPAYMPPEQAAGEEVGPASDVYALGATLYFLLTGRAPFQGGSVINLLNAVLTEPPLDPRTLRPDVSPALAELCLACLSKEPAERPGLQAFCQRLDAAGPSPPPREGRPLGAPGVAAGLVCLGVVAAALVLGLRGLSPPPPTASAGDPPPTASAGDPPPVDGDAPRGVTPDDARRATEHYKRAVALAQAGADAEALPEFDRAVELAPLWAEARLNRGLVRATLGSTEAAIEDFTQTLALNPGETLAYANRGAAYATLGDLEAALADLEAAVRLDPAHAPSWIRLGTTRGRLDDHAGAADAWERAVELAPDADWAPRFRAQIPRARALAGDR